MFAGSRGSTLASVLLAVPLFSTAASGCSCAAPGPPCEEVGRSELVFLGTVTKMTEQAGGHFKTVRMKVDHAFKGNLKKTIELVDDPLCPGPILKIGRQYLMYTSGSPDDIVPYRACTRSRRVADAREDLAFLKQYSAGKVTTRIYGTVRFRPDDGEDTTEGRTPLKGVSLTLSSGEKKVHATTDSGGAYSLSNLPPGEYVVDAELSGYYLNRFGWGMDDVRLHANGCAVADLLMKVDTKVEGTVLDNDGAPVGDALVEMVSTEEKLDRGTQFGPRTVTNWRGHYAIEGLRPGEYLLGVNIRSIPTKEYPYPRTYYPSGADPRQAVPVTIVVGASGQRFDLHVPRTLPLVTVRGRIQKSDGKPPLPQDHPWVTIAEPGIGRTIWLDPIQIDAEGRFRIEVCEGIPYSAFAYIVSMNPKSLSISAPVEFTPTQEHDQLVLVLDKTPEQFERLRRK